MKKLFFAMFVLGIVATAQAGSWHVSASFGWPGYYGYYSYYPRYTCYPYYYGPRSYSYYSYPAYSYSYSYPAYSYSSYDYYSRPNYAVGGTLLGALAGGLIGNSIDHHGWEGAGIGAATGLVLGGLAEQNARYNERVPYDRSYQDSPTVYYNNQVPNAPTVNNAPTVPDAPTVQRTSPRGNSSMSSANALFGR